MDRRYRQRRLIAGAVIVLVLIAAIGIAAGGGKKGDADASVVPSPQASPSSSAVAGSQNGQQGKPVKLRKERPGKALVWRQVKGAGKRVALTFDDGGAEAWTSILDILKAKGAHATFFVVGPYAAESPDLMKRTIAEGHAMGSHSWTHSYMTYQSAGSIEWELTRSSRPWEKVGGALAPYVRPPYGSYNSSVLAALGDAGFTRVILWDVDPQDWATPGADVIARRVLKHVKQGSIVVMHLRRQTAAALPAILDGLASRGFQAVSVPELFTAAGYGDPPPPETTATAEAPSSETTAAAD